MSRKNTYSPFQAYLIFCLIFSALMVGWILLGSHLRRRADTVQQTDPSLSSLTVVLDPGHGGEDCGAIGVNGVYEKDLNLSVSKSVAALLRAGGTKVVMTRTEDLLLYDKSSHYQGQKKVQDLMNRRKKAEEYSDGIFISIHMNAFSDPRYCGLQVWYSPNHPASQRLAEHIQTDSRALLLPHNHRQIKVAGENIYLLHHLTCPAVLVECGFLSNPGECNTLSSIEYQRQLALSLSTSILKYCKETLQTSQKQLDFSREVLYNEIVTNPWGGYYERRKNGLYLFIL